MLKISVLNRHPPPYLVLITVDRITQPCPSCTGFCVYRHRPPSSSVRSRQTGSRPSSKQHLMAAKPLHPPPMIATRFDIFTFWQQACQLLASDRRASYSTLASFSCPKLTRLTTSCSAPGWALRKKFRVEFQRAKGRRVSLALSLVLVVPENFKLIQLLVRTKLVDKKYTRIVVASLCKTGLSTLRSLHEFPIVYDADQYTQRYSRYDCTKRKPRFKTDARSYVHLDLIYQSSKSSTRPFCQ